MNVIKKCLRETYNTPSSSLLGTSPSSVLETHLEDDEVSLSDKKNDGWIRPAQIPEKQWYCHNCGKEGHQNSGCDSPITSYGIILFYHSSDRSIIEENIDIQEWYMANSNSISDSISNSNSISNTISNTISNHSNLVTTDGLTDGLTDDLTDPLLNQNCENEVTYLLILDRHTHDYAQIIIGNYEIDSIEGIDYLRKLLGRITETEANLILKHSFKDLFMKYWIYAKKDPTKIYYKQFEKANDQFMRLLRGVSIKNTNRKHMGLKSTEPWLDSNSKHSKTSIVSQISINRYNVSDRLNNVEELITWKSLIQETSPHWFDPDWGFPKGRRRRTSANSQHETDLECAMRELQEETGITQDQYRILDEIEPIQEDIKGSNGYNYRNIYYLAEARSLIPVCVDPSNVQQSSEVSKIGWYNYERASKLIRPYHTSRLRILHRIHKYLGSLCPYVNT